MIESGTLTTFKSPLYEMTQTTPTCLWNDSASIEELTYSIEHGGGRGDVQSRYRARRPEEGNAPVAGAYQCARRGDASRDRG